MIPLYEVVRIGRFMETESRTEVTRLWRRGSGELLFNGKGSGDGYTTM